MTSPAKRYAAARHLSAHPVLTEFAGSYPFELDDFQLRACAALEAGRGVLVAAPTGAGKTVVGEFAVELALRHGTKCFYTTPIKALSNQKYADLVARHGVTRVGLLTGDNAVNGSAPVVVMTTEVLRNMLYAGSTALTGLAYVVMDEVHYLADRFRGAVWEEVMIHLSDSVALVSLSATVSNAEEFGDWLTTVRGDTTVIVEEHRPVPLWQHMLVGRRMFDVFADAGMAGTELDPELVRCARDEQRRADPMRRGRAARPRWRPTPRPAVVERLDRDGLLPAITFVFSRVGCDAAVEQCRRGGLRLTTPDEVVEIRRVVDVRTAALAGEDLGVLGYWEWREGLERGLAAHHAGMLPVFKETVEELFTRGLVKAVFATETLALGINMPARTVVLERLTKWNGQTHADVTPGEYTQLTGRAGRRGIDVEGHAVVLWSADANPRRVAGLASTRTYPLRSSFRPSYNMAVNLVGQLGRDAARTLLESSFAQFQTDRSVVGLARQVQKNTDALAGYAEAMSCHLGDFGVYAGLRRRVHAREAELSRSGAAQRRAATAQSLERLRAGDVIRVPAGRRAGLAVVVDPGVAPAGETRPLVLTEERWAGRVSGADFTAPAEVLARVKVPRRFDHRSPRARRDLAATLRNAGVDRSVRRPRTRSVAAEDPLLTDLRARLRGHPCHGCADREEHARWSERHAKLARETEALTERVGRRRGNLAAMFDAVCGVLSERGYLAGEQVTADGRRLARIWSESDLLVAECLRRGVWDGLEPAELAAAVSMVVYESRRVEEGAARVPYGPLAEVLTATTALWSELADDERDHGLTLTRAPDGGFAWPVHRWACGEPLGRVLAAGAGPDGLPAGDFVRWCRQLLDLLDQVAGAASGTPLGRTARSAIDAIRRGVVAVSEVG